MSLTKYVQIAKNDWRYCPVVATATGRVKQDMVLVGGKRERHEEGNYSLDFYEEGKRRRVSVGKDAAAAQAEQLRKSRELDALAHGVEIVRSSARPTLADACAEFLEEVKQQRRHKTYNQYSVALRYLQECCPAHARISDIGRSELLRFSAYLQHEKKLSDRTRWTKFAVAVQLLKQYGITGALKRRDWPRFVQTEPETYSDDQLDRFFAACSFEEQVVFSTFLMAGLREQELQCAYRTDVDFKEQVIRVTAKPEIGFIPKNWEQREVPIPDQLAKLLRRHVAECATKTRLLFATTEGKKDCHFLEKCKQIALRAGVNCGVCPSQDGHSSCAEHANCHEWFLHKFRATSATKHLRSGVDLRTVQLWMGHKDLASTMRYLQPARGRDVRAKVNNTFSPTITRSD